MPMPRTYKWFAVEDAKIAPITADPEGGTTTHGALLDVPGIKSIGLSGEVSTVALRGDNQQLDANSVLTGLSVKVAHAKISLDVLAAMLGYVVTEAGTAPAERIQADLTAAGAQIKPFYLEGKTPTGGTTIGGDGHMIFWKCVLSAYPETGFVEEGYANVGFEAAVVPRASDGKWHRIVANQTAVAIATVPAA